VTKERFSKQTLADHVFRNLRSLHEEHRFDPDNGWSQVIGKSQEINRAYGRWEALTAIADIYGLWPLRRTETSGDIVKPVVDPGGLKNICLRWTP
jgi:hypothetical protein